MAIKFTAEGARVRVSKRSGTVLPPPEALAKARRAARPMEPGPRDTPAELVAAVTYHPPPSLLPYLAAAGARSLFRPRGGAASGSGGGAAEAAVPRKLRYVRMRSHHRKAIRGRWERGQAEARVVAEAEATLRALAAGAGGGGGGEAGAAGTAAGGGASSGGEQRAELR